MNIDGDNTALSHFSTLRNDDVKIRLLILSANVFNLPHDIHAINHFTEDYVLVIKEVSLDGRDEEL